MRGKVKELNKQELLLQMVEEDLTLKEPKSLMKWLYCFWALVGVKCLVWSRIDGSNNLKTMVDELMSEKQGVNYNDPLWKIIKNH